MDWEDDARNTKKIYQANLHQNDVRGEPRVDGKMMYRMTQEIWKLLTGDK
jgi:hypothetical protein